LEWRIPPNLVGLNQAVLDELYRPGGVLGFLRERVARAEAAQREGQGGGTKEVRALPACGGVGGKASCNHLRSTELNVGRGLQKDNLLSSSSSDEEAPPQPRTPWRGGSLAAKVRGSPVALR
jgi:hypothetical protein